MPDQELSQRLDARASASIRRQAARDLSDLVRPELHRFLKQACKAPLSPEDVEGDIWIKLFTAIEAGKYHHDASANPVGWAMTIAANVVRSLGTAQRQHQEREHHLSEDHWDDLEHPVSDDDEIPDPSLLASIDTTRWSDEERSALSLIRQGRTIADIAEAQRTTYKTAWRRWHRVVALCRTDLTSRA